MVVHVTNLDRVKTRVGQVQDDTEDAALLARWIPSVTSAIENYMGRGIEEMSRVETLSPRPGARIVQLSAYPIVSVDLVEDDADGIFGDNAAVVAPGFFGINERMGRLNLSSWFLAGGTDSLRITYVGGMAETTDEFIARWPAIAGAAETQIAQQYRRRFSDGYSSVGGTQTGSVGVQGEVIELSAGVKSILDSYRNLAL